MGQPINKGIIYPVRYSELDFTVPEVAGFIRRLEEYKQWYKKGTLQQDSLQSTFFYGNAYLGEICIF